MGLHNYGGQKVPWSAICKLESRKVSGTLQSKFKGLRTREANGIRSSLRFKAQELGVNGVNPGMSRKAQEPGTPMSESRRWMSQLKKRASEPFQRLFVSWEPKGLDDAHQHWWGPSFLSNIPIQMLILSGNTLTDTPRNAFASCLGIPLAQTSGQIKLTITVQYEITLLS